MSDILKLYKLYMHEKKSSMVRIFLIVLYLFCKIHTPEYITPYNPLLN